MHAVTSRPIHGDESANPESLPPQPHAATSRVPDTANLSRAMQMARDRLAVEQQQDGHWIYPLEADCTIPAEYILMNHFVGEVDPNTEQGMAAYLRDKQHPEGGWTLFPGGDFDMSVSVKAYYALKLAGDPMDAAHMVRAKEAILARGGAAKSNVFTRITLALFGQVPWRATPFIPAEIILFPRWFPFHLLKVAYWSRTVMVPLFVLCTLKPRAINPQGVEIAELFTIPPQQERHYFVRPKNWFGRLFLALDTLGRFLEPWLPDRLRQYAVRRCEQWFLDHMNEGHGIGGIFPAMVNVFECLVVLGYPENDPARKQARQAIDALVVQDKEQSTTTWCQACVSPVWDTCLAAQAMIEVESGQALIDQALDWLQSRQLREEPGDWRLYRPDVVGGGWAFQYSNYHYPDLDDTAMVAWAMCRHDPDRYRETVARAARWLVGMQSRNGGFAAFDADNTCYYLNTIPFADHGALLDPPTADVTARVVACLALAGKGRYRAPLRKALDYLKREQESCGAWFGRWGTNYIYGTWSVLSALEVAGEDPRQDYIQAAADWLCAVQGTDGGWGESNRSYCSGFEYCSYPATPHQTAWAILALLAAGRETGTEVQAGIQYLLDYQNEGGVWDTPDFNAPGFPRVFYLKYHGYSRYFPLWALARYHNVLCCQQPLSSTVR